MSTQYLREIVGDVSHVAIRHWLKISSLRYTGDFFKLLNELIVKGDLRIEQLRRIVLEIEEYGAKRIYIGKLSNYRKNIGLKQAFENHLSSIGLRLSPEPVSAKKLPSRPTLNYIVWSPQEVRIGYSETHQFIRVSKASISIDTVPQTNLITISAEPSTGFMKIMMDAPGDKNPHQVPLDGRKIESYETFYQNKALQILGADQFRPLDLLRVAEGIVKPSPMIFDLTESDVRTSHNSRQRTWNRSDVRDDPVYTAGEKVDGEDRVHESLSGYWLPETSGGQLHRKLFMHLSRREGMVRFSADCLASEVEYAISRIREV